MDPAIYKFVHYIGIFLLLSGLGAYCFGKNDGPNKLAGISHGVGFLLVLLGGFGMAKHEAISFSWWFLVKAAIFGLVLSVVGCQQGIHATGGAKGVGLATTRAVVISCIVILIVDYVLTSFLL